MRTATMDFSPLYRSSIGFDRLFNLLENAVPSQNGDGWPPFDIVKQGEDAYRIMLAVAGFGEADLTVTHEPNLLVINGTRPGDEEMQYLHRGLALRPFARRFELADHMSVVGAKLENGLLVIDLKKEIPEEMKPRQIAIDAGEGKKRASKQIEADRAA
jgi:molecular chaperone IbpA